MAVTTAEVLRRSAGASIGYGLLFAASLPFVCLLGVPSTLALLALVGRQLDGVVAGGARQRDDRFRGSFFLGLFLGLAVLASLGGMAVARTLFPTMDDDPRSLLGMGVTLGVAFAIVLPYAFVPLVQRDGDVPSGVGGNAFVLAAQAMTRLPSIRRILLVLVAVAAQAAPLGLFLFLEGHQGLLDAIAAALGAYALLVPLASAHYVAAYASVRDGLEHDPLGEDPVAVPASLRAAGVSALLGGFALLLLLGEALLAPLPMAVATPGRPLTPVPGIEPIPIGEGGVLVRSAGRGVTVAARDGGGVGFVASGCGAVARVAVEPIDDEGYRITAFCDAGGLRELRVDAGGVRLDDSFGHRFEARVGGFFWPPFALAVVFWLAALGGPWRSFQQARYIRALRSTGELDQAPGIRVLEGRLQAAEGLTIAAGRFRTGGAAQVAGGPLRIALPDEGPALGEGEEQLADGAPVAVIGSFEELVSGTFREAAAPFPGDGWLVPGDRSAAAERLTRPAAARLAFLFGAATVAEIVAAVALVLGW